MNGLFGVLAVGIFANGNTAPAGTADDEGAAVEGVVNVDWACQLGAQALGVLVILTVIFGIAFAFFKIQNAWTKGGSVQGGGRGRPRSARDGRPAYPEFTHNFEIDVDAVGIGAGDVSTTTSG